MLNLILFTLAVIAVCTVSALVLSATSTKQALRSQALQVG